VVAKEKVVFKQVGLCLSKTVAEGVLCDLSLRLKSAAWHIIQAVRRETLNCMPGGRFL
jgi:hypothetical protein